MEQSISGLIRRILRDTWERKYLVIFTYLVTALVFLFLALIWPKVYTSSSTILVERQDVMNQLLGGGTPVNTAVDHSQNAREVVFSRKSMERILSEIKWFDKDPTPAEKEAKAESIRNKTQIFNLADDLLRITYKDKDAKRAFETTNLMTEIFVQESLEAKRQESKDAYDYIVSKVKEYDQKLAEIDGKISDFIAKNIDSTPGAEAATDERILQLSRELERTELEILEEETKLSSQQSQLSGHSGAENSASILREGQLNSRIEELEAQVANLRLTYMDDYPDIVQLKNQIAVFEQRIQEEIDNRKAGVATSSEMRDGPIAQELQRQILRTQTNIKTLNSRKEQTELLLKKAQEKKERIYAAKSEIAVLNRERAVNQQKHQELMTRKENAYITWNIDDENQGMSIKIQEAASMPVSPKGIRFAHLILAGIVLSFGAPIVLAYLISMLDGKVRDIGLVVKDLDVPIIAELSEVKTPAMHRQNLVQAGYFAVTILLVWSLYGYQILSRIAGTE